MPPKGSYRYTKEQLEEAVRTSTTIAEVLRRIGLVPRGGNYDNLRKHCREWGIDMSHLEPSHNPRSRWDGYDRMTDEEIATAVRASRSYAQALRTLGAPIAGGGYAWLKRAIDRLGIGTGHMDGQGWAAGLTFPDRRASRIPLDEILVDGRFVQTSRIRERLVEEGLKARRCERCGRSEWEGELIPLELDHVNGRRDDNRLENLRLLCPNCHALTPTYRGRNIGNGGRVCGEDSAEHEAV